MNKIKKLIGFVRVKTDQLKTITIKQDSSKFNWYLFNVFFGLLISEIYYFGTAIGNAFFAWMAIEHVSIDLIKTSSILLVITVLSYCFFRMPFESFSFYRKNINFYIQKIIFSLLGVVISCKAGGIFYEEYQLLISKIYLESLVFIVAIPALICLVFSIVALSKLIQKKQNNKQSFFLNDSPIVALEDDLLEVDKNAERFANLVLNQNSSDSLIFGIDSPWGVGKTSFINRCKSNWDKLDEEDRPIVVCFDPIKYLSQDKLSEKLANEISQALNKHSRNPILNSSFEKYINILKENNQISLFGINLKIPTNINFKAEFDTLQNEIGGLNRKIIIVVDDLDRLSWQESKKILYGIKQSFNLKNVSFILCYDTNNLSLNSRHNNDEIDVVEFLEKFVNVKFTLFVDSAKLAKLVSTDSEKLLKKIEFGSAIYFDQINNILSSLNEIYTAKNYYKFAHFCGDLRKVKRLINSLLMLDIHSLNIKNSDIDGGDLIRLMMLYIGFPQTFREVYDAEMNGCSGHFSLNLSEDTTGRYLNGSSFTEKINLENNISSEEIILKSLFDIDTLEKDNKCKIDELNKSNRACFNGVNGSPRNLERYLDLIVNLRKQPKLESSKFYDDRKEAFMAGLPLTEIFLDQDFDDNDRTMKLLNAIGNNAEMLDSKQAYQIVEYITKNIEKFALTGRELFETDDRSSLIYILLKVIDRGLWRCEGIYDNSNENLKIITDLIFGEGEFIGKSIINVLTNDSRLPLGFYDLLLFRLYCSANRANSLFNIQRALSIRYSKSAPTEGAVDEIARVGMRQITQAIFQRFKEAYLDTKRNFYSEVLKLGTDDLNGKQLVDPKTITQNSIEKTKSTVLGFVIYQLSNKLLQSGIGCGYYDPTGEDDQNKISHLMNNYLFYICFNPKIDFNNIENFLHYLLNHMSSPLNIGGRTLEPLIEELTKVLDKQMLLVFWRKNRDIIIKANFHARETVFYNVNYEVSYKEYLPKIYKMLDDELESMRSDSHDSRH